MSMMFVAPHVAAQLELDVNRLRPVGDPSGILTSEGAAIPEAMQWRVSFALQEAVWPLVLDHADGVREPLVENRVGASLWGTVGLFDIDLGGPRLRLGLSGEMESVLFQNGSLRSLVPLGASPTLDQMAFGDIRSRFRAGFHADAWDVTLEGQVSIPSGNAKAMSGDGMFLGVVAVAAGGALGPFRGLVRFGFRMRPEIDLRILRTANEWWTQAGAVYEFNGTWFTPRDLGVEVDFASWSSASFSKPATRALEGRIGARWCAGWLLLTGAVGTGMMRAYGVPAFRALTSVGYAPGECGSAKFVPPTLPALEAPAPPPDIVAPAEIERVPPPPPQVIVEPAPARVESPPAKPPLADPPQVPLKIVDFDEDGVLDSVDQCFDKPGPAANHGCPEEPVPAKPAAPPEEVPPDEDGDGVPDLLDFCPEKPGRNQGCPEK
jgi:hypothetical protein